MRRVLAAVGLAAAQSGVLALARSDYVALGVSFTAMAVASASAGYVYFTVARGRRQSKRVRKVEKQANEIQQRLTGK